MSIINHIYHRLNERKHEIVDMYFSENSWIFATTTIIKSTIRDVANLPEYNYSVCTHFLDGADEGEWIFDITLCELEYKNEETKIVSIPLVVESELSKTSFGGFKEDFDKLLIATSSERLFICRKTLYNQLDFNKFINYASESVNTYKSFISGDIIYLIYWDETEKKNQEFKLIKLIKK